MKQNTVWVLQSIGIGLSVVNAGVATVTHNALIALLVGAVAAGFSAYAQHLGNQSVPPSVSEAEAMKKSAGNYRTDFNDAERFDLAVRQIVGKRLTFDQLTGKDATCSASLN